MWFQPIEQHLVDGGDVANGHVMLSFVSWGCVERPLVLLLNVELF